MTPPQSNVANSDRELLALARSILSQENFVVEDVTDDLSLLLAENAYFLVGVAATPTIAQLLMVESAAVETILARLNASDPGPKRWDAYLILLTQERSPESRSTTRDLFEINYDTANLRRISHAGVRPTLSDVRDALTPFVAPIKLDDPTIARDAFDGFIEGLTARGVDRDLARRAVSAFQQGVPLGDIL